MHCCCSFPEGLESVASDPLLLIAVPSICHGVRLERLAMKLA